MTVSNRIFHITLYIIQLDVFFMSPVYLFVFYAAKNKLTIQ